MKQPIYSIAAGLLLTASALFGGEASAAVHYVKAGATGDGTSWQSAAGDLQSIIDAAQAGDEVWVASGTYKPTTLIKSSKKRSYAFMLKDGVSLYGGFAGTEASKDERAKGQEPWAYTNATVLSADDDVPDVWTRKISETSTHLYMWTVTGNENNYNHIIYTASTLAQRTEVEGFTLKGAYADVLNVKSMGAAVYASGWLELRNCQVMENASKSSGYSSNPLIVSGAVSLLKAGGKGTIEGCLFERNQANISDEGTYGGGAYAENAVIKNCTFRGCVSPDNGGGLYLNGGSATGCTFEDCYGGSGGGAYNAGGEISESSFTLCRAINGGALYQSSGSAQHLKIYNNYADTYDFGSENGGKGGGIFLIDGTVVGSAVWNSTAFLGGGVFVMGGKLVNSTVQNCAARSEGAPGNVGFGTNVESSATVFNCIRGNAVEESNFVNPTTVKGWDSIADFSKASWELSKASEYIDAGTLTDGVTETTDLAGNPRVSGESIDVGAYEYQWPVVQTEPNIVLTFDQNTESVRIGTGGGDGTSFQVDWGDGQKKSYDGAQYVSGVPVNKEVRIYGNDLLILQAVSQGITAADVTRATNLSRIQLGGNKLTALDVTHNTALTGLYCEENQLTSLNVASNSLLRVLDCHSNKIAGTVDCSAMNALTKVDCSDNQVTELLLPTTENLTQVICGQNQIASLDVSGLTALDELSCNDNQLTTLDLSHNTKLTSLYCPTNKIASLDVSACKSLETLTAFENEIASIDLSQNTALTGLYLQDNKLTALDATACTSLQWVNLKNNQLKQFDTSKFPSLRLFDISNNQLATLDVTSNPMVMTLHVDGNQLTALDVTAQKSLSWLSCAHNQITNLDLSKNPYLYWLECNDNKLTALNLSGKTYLQKLVAGNNQIATLDLSGLKGLQGVLIEGNKLDAAQLNAIIEALPDVSQVEIQENNSEWARQLNISFMPGTAEANVADAKAKGWIVTAESAPSGVGSLDADDAQVSSVRYFTPGGIEISQPAKGVTIKVTTYTSGKTQATKMIK